LYRSGALAGEYHLIQFNVPNGVLRQGDNEVNIRIGSGSNNMQWQPADTKVSIATSLRGITYSSILLEFNS
jgi:hypothetical protein